MGDNGFRPFHETVAEAILRASGEELQLLGRLIKTTKIPKNHDYIIMAWNQRKEEMLFDDDFGVTESLLTQKEAAERKAKETPKSEKGKEDSIFIPFDWAAINN